MSGFSRTTVRPTTYAKATVVRRSCSEGGHYDRLTGVAGTSLTFTNSQNTWTVAYDANTRFRRAALQNWAPTDPYYDEAVDYNNFNFINSDTSSLSLLLSTFEGGNVRILLVPPNPVLPSDPYHILSFQPIP